MFEMDKLPDLVLFKIFSFLDITNLIKCKRLCKRVQRLISDEIKLPNELILANFNFFDRYDKFNYWFNSFKPVNLNNTIFIPNSYDTLNFLINFNSLFKIFSKIKSLKIHECCLDVNVFEKFPKLEYLEINSVLFEDELTNELVLPNLKILEIGNIDYEFRIDCNKLKILKFDIEDNIEFVHSETVEYLEVIEQSDYLGGFNPGQFINLKIFKCQCFYTFDWISGLSSTIEQVHLNHLNEKAFNLLQDFKNLKIFLKGIELDKKSSELFNENFIGHFDNPVELESDTIEAFNEKDFKYINLIQKNFDKMADKLDWYTTFNYSKLMEIFNNNLPTTFFDKFINIQYIRVDKPTDLNQFQLFLNKCPNLNELELYYPSLEQRFYDKLPSICNLLQVLVVEENEELNYEFILKFKIIRHIKILNYLPNEEFIKNIFNNNNLKYFTEFKFGANKEKQFEIEKIRFLSEDKDKFVFKNEIENFHQLKMEEVLTHLKEFVNDKEFVKSKKIKLN